MKQTLTGPFLDHGEGKLSFEEQLSLAKKHEINEICLRYYNRKPLLEASDKDIKSMLQLMKENKIKGAILDTLIKSYDITSDAKFSEAFDQFKFMVKLSDKFKINHLFLTLPKINDVIKEYDLIHKRLSPFIDYAYKNGKKNHLYA